MSMVTTKVSNPTNGEEINGRLLYPLLGTSLKKNRNLTEHENILRFLNSDLIDAK